MNPCFSIPSFPTLCSGLGRHQQDGMVEDLGGAYLQALFFRLRCLYLSAHYTCRGVCREFRVFQVESRMLEVNMEGQGNVFALF